MSRPGASVSSPNDMRDIKFRAWDREKRKMIRPFWADGMIGLFHPFDPNHCDLLQFTCLKDKDGKEIYEGDIVEVAHYAVLGAKIGERTTVTFKDGAFDPFVRDHWGPTYRERWPAACCVVIGNIYENPELTGRPL